MTFDPSHPIPGYDTSTSHGPLTATIQASIDAANRAAYGPGTNLPANGGPYPGASLYGSGFSGVVGTTSSAGILYTTYSNGQIVNVTPGGTSTDTTALGRSFGLDSVNASTTGTGWANPSSPSSSYLSPGVSGPSSVPLGTTGAQGSLTQPGGTVSGALSSLLAGLSHTTAGLNWSTIALWLAILAGGYVVLSGLVPGGKRR